MSSDTNFGTGYYLSSGGGGGGTENFGKIQRGDRSNLFEKSRRGGGGSRKSSKVTRGDHFGEATFKGGIG